MKVTAQEEYGLRCMLQAVASGPDRPMTVASIASSEGISIAYAGKLLNLLRDAGLVDSVRGRAGGYYITRPPESISIAEILAALGGNLFEADYCERFPGEEDECVHIGGCSLRSLWGTLEGLINQVLRRTTLADLLKSEARVTADLSSRQRRHLPLFGDPLGVLSTGSLVSGPRISATEADEGHDSESEDTPR